MDAALPPGLTIRPLRMEDAGAVYELMADLQRHELGRVDIELADIVGDWQRPSFDLASSTVGVFDGDRLVGYVEQSVRGDAAVHPDHHGRGIGTWLALQMQELGRQRGVETVGMPVPQGRSGDRLLEALGYHVRWTSWVLQLPQGKDVPARELPEGYAVRQAGPDEFGELHDVIEDAFLEWSVRERESFEDFEAETVLRPGFEPWMMRVVTDPEGRIAAVAVAVLSDQHEAYVDRLATRSDQRHRGLAQALLVDTFAAGREHGAVTFGLATDSRTGALDLYRKVGMEVIDVWVNRGIAV